MKTTSLWLLAALAVSGACTKSSSDSKVDELAKRVEKLEAAQKGFTEIDGFVRPIMAQQKQQAAQREASEPDPNARFAVDITGSPTDGPAGAAVTIIEAFDFA